MGRHQQGVELARVFHRLTAVLLFVTVGALTPAVTGVIEKP